MFEKELNFEYSGEKSMQLLNESLCKKPLWFPTIVLYIIYCISFSCETFHPYVIFCI